MSARGTRELHTYLGPEDAPLFGTVHLPVSGEVRATVLFCPPLGKEQFDTVRGLRLLANGLAQAGIAVLRLDYYGTGDSAYEAERDDAVELWAQSVRHGLDYLRSLAPVDPGVVALRAGALIAAFVLASPDTGALGPVVLWDPVTRGRAYVREQRALFAMTAGREGVPEGTVPLIGTALTEGSAAALSRLSLDPAAAPAAKRWLVVARPDAQDQVLDAFAEAARADRLTATGMAEFCQAPGFLVQIPGGAVESIRSWLDAAVPSDAVPASAPVRRSTSLESKDGTRVVERIEPLDGRDVFAIRTSAQNPATSRVALFFATANDTHHGPNRAWVALSRELAAAGSGAIRFDRRGAGETSPPAADELTPLYGQEATDDASAAASAAGKPEDVIAVGVCSGGWHAASMGRAGRAAAVVIINANVWSWRHKRVMRELRPGPDPGYLGVPRSDPAFQNSPRGQVKALLQRRLPYPAWRLLGKLGITQVPEVLLRPLTAASVEVTTILSPHDSGWFDGQRGPEGLRRLPAPVRVVRTGVGDHTAYHPMVIAAVRDAILEWCTRTAALFQPALAESGDD